MSTFDDKSIVRRGIFFSIGEVGTIKKLVNYALALLKSAMVERSKGHKICSVRQEGGETVMQELEMLVLAAASIAWTPKNTARGRLSKIFDGLISLLVFVVS